LQKNAITLLAILDHELEGNTKGKGKDAWAPKPKELKKSCGLTLQKPVSIRRLKVGIRTRGLQLTTLLVTS